MDRNMIDAASSRALVKKTAKQARQLIANMVANSQQFGTRESTPSMPTYKDNEVSVSSFEQQIANLTSLVQNMATGGAATQRVCGMFYHRTPNRRMSHNPN